MQIHELNDFQGTPSSTDYLPIDNGVDTSKIPATALGVSTQMTQAEATEGSVTAPRVIAPKVLHDFTQSFVLNMFYPVGSYYETSDANFDPNAAWGGTWVLEEEGLVHIGAGANYAIGAKGGEKTHNHLYRIRYGSNYCAVVGDEPIIRLYDYETNQYITTAVSTATGNALNAGNQNGTRTQPHGISAYEAHTSRGNNLQPYVVVNRWHRIA